MQDVPKNGILAVQTLRNNIMASTLLASTAIMLCSLIGIMMTNGSQNHSLFFVYGDKSSLGFSIKFFSILVCFLISFLSNVQSIRYFSHASVLINVPYRKVFRPTEDLERVTSEYVSRTVNKGSYFWSLGLRAIYFSFPLFLWIFGPIPMIFSCFAMVILLYFLDVNFECGSVRVRVPGDGDEELAREETE
ncbi:hypothetical protein SAY86_011111 [Trapa natans]|uniref:DUF599 domain-containing protein n=1 Tax=Trapa natans TaxID=22666 RepID=A0AAN7R667_TRANT|nr:hypothetical protein SAY86_011111 [Trapa natans]